MCIDHDSDNVTLCCGHKEKAWPCSGTNPHCPPFYERCYSHKMKFNWH